MPIPKPKQGEDKNSFINRCMSNDTMKKEYPDSQQRTAVCIRQWNNKGESMEENKKVSESGRKILAENVMLEIKGTVGVSDDGSTED